VTTTKPLTVRTLVYLADLAGACQRTERVRWLLEGGVVAEGTARCFAHQGGGFLNSDEDVRDAYVHISGNGEIWLPVSDVLALMERGEFAIGA